MFWLLVSFVLGVGILDPLKMNEFFCGLLTSVKRQFSISVETNIFKGRGELQHSLEDLMSLTDQNSLVFIHQTRWR